MVEIKKISPPRLRTVNEIRVIMNPVTSKNMQMSTKSWKWYLYFKFQFLDLVVGRKVAIAPIYPEMTNDNYYLERNNVRSKR